MFHSPSFKMMLVCFFDYEESFITFLAHSQLGNAERVTKICSKGGKKRIHLWPDKWNLHKKNAKKSITKIDHSALHWDFWLFPKLKMLCKRTKIC